MSWIANPRRAVPQLALERSEGMLAVDLQSTAIFVKTYLTV
jgi:hypothetical protein